jgi:NitT/TauT family transport system substrate-binding protein
MTRIHERRRRLLLIAAAGVAAPFAATPGRTQGASVPLRIGVIGSSGQAELTTVIQKFGLDREHGIDMQVTDYAAPGQQYTLLRAGTIDVAIGNFVDLHRQRRAGLGIKAFHGFQSYNNPVIVKTGSPITQFSELRGRKIGGFGNTFLDWLVLRAAGKKAHGVDVETDASTVVAAPPLLTQLLMRGEIDAAIQFSSLAIAPLTAGEVKAISDLAILLRQAQFNVEAFYTQWFITEQWLDRNAAALAGVYAMFAAGYDRLAKDDAVWTELAQRIRITDPKLVAAYREKGRQINNPPYRASLLQPTQALLTEIVSIAGEQATGIARIDPQAFVFPSGAR